MPMMARMTIHGASGARGVGEHGQAEANQPVGAHFQHDGGQHDGAGGGRFHVRVGQPGVQREERNLDGESHEEGQEEERFLRVREGDLAAARADRGSLRNRKCRRGCREDDRGQHQHRTGHGVQEKLDGGVDAAVVAPDADQEIHGHQHDFPEHEEQEQIPCGEDTDEAEFEQQQEGEEFLDLVVDGFPREQDGDGRQERGEDDQPETEAVDAHVIVDFGILDPDEVGDELLAGLAGLKSEGEPERERRKAASETTSVNRRIICSCARGRSSVTAKPMAGRAMRTSRRFSQSGTHRTPPAKPHNQQQDHRAEHHPGRVTADIAGLDAA